MEGFYRKINEELEERVSKTGRSFIEKMRNGEVKPGHR